MTALSIAVGFRDRDVQRVERYLASLAKQTFDDFEVLFVDYGSQPQTAQVVQKVIEQHPFARYIYTETRGYAWNRAHALNIGCKQAQGEYLLTTDVDMIFLPNFLQIMLDFANPHRELRMLPHQLPENFTDWENIATYQGRLEQSDRIEHGVYLLSTAVFHQMRGYDEYYRYYGGEDRDISHRLRLLGIEEYWLNDKTTIFHQWHSAVDYAVRDFMPDGVTWRMETYFHHHQHEIVRNSDDWGKLHNRENRTIFRFIDVDNQTLRIAPELRIVNLDPTQNQSIDTLSEILFNDLLSGHAIAINHAFFPKHTARSTFVHNGLNRLLHRINPGMGIDYGTNSLHDFVINYVEPPASGVADYYLNLPVMDGVSVIVKA